MCVCVCVKVNNGKQSVNAEKNIEKQSNPK